MSNVTVISLQNDQLDWYRRHPDRLFAAIFSRMDSGELDRYPGYARWDGDGVPGMMVAWNNDLSKVAILAVGKGSVQRMVVCNRADSNSHDHDNQVKLMKEWAAQLGYSVKKKTGSKKSTSKKVNKNA